MLTGCRRSEVLNLHWRYIGSDGINLPDSETGPRAVLLDEAAQAQIEALPGVRHPEAHLFPRQPEGWGEWILTLRHRLCRCEAQHTAASHAVMSGGSLPLVGKLLGHQRQRTTTCYAHLADAHLVEAAEKVGEIIAGAVDGSADEPLFTSPCY